MFAFGGNADTSSGSPVLSENSIRWSFSQRFSLICGKQFPVSARKLPVRVRREFG
jgi:hypothetical protein